MIEPSTERDPHAVAALYVDLMRHVQQAMDAVAERFPALGAHVSRRPPLRDVRRWSEELLMSASPAVGAAFDAWTAAWQAVNQAVESFKEFRDNHHADGPAEQAAYTSELTRRIAALGDCRSELDEAADRLERAIADELTAAPR